MAPLFKDKRHLVGMILVLIGVVLILDNIRFIPDFIPWWVWTWQMLLIAIGVFSLLTSENQGPGFVLIGIGSVFLLWDILPDMWPGFFDFFVDDSNIFWYLIIIIVGVSLLFRHRGPFRPGGPDKKHPRRPRFGREDESAQGTSFNSSSTSENDYLDELAIFGGGEKIITSNNFRGGRVTTIFGGADIILMHSKLAEGINEIEVFSMFGGWTFRVPPNWQVKNEVVAIFGGVSDKRYLDDSVTTDNTRQLVIKGFVMFGGGEIK
jgi:predicted membrane protein